AGILLALVVLREGIPVCGGGPAAPPLTLLRLLLCRPALLRGLLLPGLLLLRPSPVPGGGRAPLLRGSGVPGGLGALHGRHRCRRPRGTPCGTTRAAATAACGRTVCHVMTPALWSSVARASRCSSVGGNCGSRGTPAGIPRSSSAALDIDTPPSARWASKSGRSPRLIRRAVSTSPERKVRRSSTSRAAATWPTTLTNPEAPTANHGRLSWSSPE